MNHAKKATPHLKMKETASNDTKSSSASLNLARPAIPMDCSIVWVATGSTLQDQAESHGQSPCIYERSRPNRHPNDSNTAEISHTLLAATIPMGISIGARFLSRPNASQGHKSLQIANQSELQYAEYTPARPNHPPIAHRQLDR